MNLEPRRIGPADRQILALLQRPHPSRPHKAAVLMCRPFGQESIRTAAIYRALSDRLAREGCSVLVFDAHGCGDSPGEPDQQSLDDWVQDTLCAEAQLRLDAPNVPLHWYGMGLGATVALRAAARAPIPPRGLLAWEPVLEGPAYLDRLLAAHRHELARELDHSWATLRRRDREPEPTLPGNVLGFTVGPRLHEDLHQLGRPALAGLSQRGIRLVIALPAGELHRADVMGLGQARLQAVEQSIDWMSTEALGKAIVPPDITRTMLACLP